MKLHLHTSDNREYRRYSVLWHRHAELLSARLTLHYLSLTGLNFARTPQPRMYAPCGKTPVSGHTLSFVSCRISLLYQGEASRQFLSKVCPEMAPNASL